MLWDMIKYPFQNGVGPNLLRMGVSGLTCYSAKSQHDNINRKVAEIRQISAFEVTHGALRNDLLFYKEDYKIVKIAAAMTAVMAVLPHVSSSFIPRSVLPYKAAMIQNAIAMTTNIMSVVSTLGAPVFLHSIAVANHKVESAYRSSTQSRV